jgi:lysozyme family protein
MTTDRIGDVLDALIAREGGYSDNPNDRGGPTRYGITEQVARAYGHTGPMSELPLELARSIYRERYWTGPKFDQVESRSTALSDELLDSGVNMGPATASKFLQRALNVLNRGQDAYPDVIVDGAIGRMTLYALDQLIAKRGATGVLVLLRMLNGQQTVRYIEIAEADPSQESYEFGWVLNRVA